MHRPVCLALLLVAAGCRGHLIESDLPGTNETPTTNAALAFRFGGLGSEQIAAMVADASGNVYLAGGFTGAANFATGTGLTVLTSLGASDGFVAKYSSTGTLIWATRFGGTQNEVVNTLARDGSGNLYVGGGFSGASDFDPSGGGGTVLNSVGGEDGFVAKYAPDGALLWARRFGGSGSDEVSQVASDAGGNVYAVGTFSGQANALPTPGPGILSQGASDGFILALDPSGTVRWALPLGGLEDDAASAVAVAGNTLTVAGSFRASADFSRNGAPTLVSSLGGSDVFLASYSTTGVLQRVSGFGGTGEESLAPRGLTLDPLGNAALLGTFSGSVDFDPGAGSTVRTSLGSSDLFLARYDPAGALLSVATVGGSQGTLGALRVLADADGSTLLAGRFSGAVDFDPGSGTRVLTSFGTNGATDAFVARYSPLGGLLWVSRFGESTALAERTNAVTALALDPTERVLAAGVFFGSPDFDPGSSALRLTSVGAADAFVVLLTASGALATTP